MASEDISQVLKTLNLNFKRGFASDNVCYKLQSGAEVDRRTRAGQATSMHRAAYAGHIEVVKVLLQHGASMEAQDSDGQTCLHKACKSLINLKHIIT